MTTIYFDENKEAYAQIETLERWGSSLLFQCTDEEYREYLEGKRIWQNGKLVINPNYAAEQAAKERAARIEEIKEALNELDKKRIRAMCEPSEYAKGVSWLEYYNEQARELRAELQELEGADIDSNSKK